MTLPVPRLQIVWEKDPDGDYPDSFIATYEMILYEGEEALLDIRANDEEDRPSAGSVRVKMGETRCSGGNNPFKYESNELSIPFRDGVHMMRDSIRLGDLPMYVIYDEIIQEQEQELVMIDGRTVNKKLLNKC